MEPNGEREREKGGGAQLFSHFELLEEVNKQGT